MQTLPHKCRPYWAPCNRTVVEVSPPRCAHGCLLPSTPDGCLICQGCKIQGGAFVLADGHVRGMESFGREPIYDKGKRDYRDLDGADLPLPGYFRPTIESISHPDLEPAIGRQILGERVTTTPLPRKRDRAYPVPQAEAGIEIPDARIKRWFPPTFEMIWEKRPIVLGECAA